MTLGELDSLQRAAFVSALGGVYERSPWVAERAYDRAPFGSIDALAEAMQQVVLRATRDEQIALIRAHPELAGREALAGQMSASSIAEQASAGLDACSAAELAHLREGNAAYAAKFGFPFVLAVGGHTRSSILARLDERLVRDRETEIREALQQIGRIARLRLALRIDA